MLALGGEAGSAGSPTLESGDRSPASDHGRLDSWLCKLTIQESPSEVVGTEAAAIVDRGADHGERLTTADLPCGPRRTARASEQGYLPIGLDTYLSLLDWTGRQIRAADRTHSPCASTAQDDLAVSPSNRSTHGSVAASLQRSTVRRPTERDATSMSASLPQRATGTSTPWLVVARPPAAHAHHKCSVLGWP